MFNINILTNILILRLICKYCLSYIWMYVIQLCASLYTSYQWWNNNISYRDKKQEICYEICDNKVKYKILVKGGNRPHLPISTTGLYLNVSHWDFSIHQLLCHLILNCKLYLPTCEIRRIFKQISIKILIASHYDPTQNWELVKVNKML